MATCGLVFRYLAADSGQVYSCHSISSLTMPKRCACPPADRFVPIRSIKGNGSSQEFRPHARTLPNCYVASAVRLGAEGGPARPMDAQVDTAILSLPFASRSPQETG